MKTLTPKTCVVVNVSVVVFLAFYFFLLPGVRLLIDLQDPGLRSNDIPHFAWRWHRDLTPRYERWARQRLAAGPAPGLDDLGVAGTEWPVFGSVFYLWATDDLQQAYEQDPAQARIPPGTMPVEPSGPPPPWPWIPVRRPGSRSIGANTIWKKTTSSIACC